ncbi:MAG: dolichol-phosphate mannosyltransferase [Candidatus Sumerlaeota bacterium]|nr:dolichol-phosphate mannosyltransferase [Candidatus Sumerlaeota bacterium]
MARLFISLPAYNEEGSLPPLLRSFARLFRQLPAGYDPLIVVVDDGSKDGTARIVRRAAKKGLPIELVRHPRNKGLGEAIKTGLRRVAELSTSEADFVVCMDADDTHPPCHIPAMLECARRNDADIVIASRYRRGSQQHGVPLNRQAMSLGALLLFKAFLNLPGVRDYTCGYRAYRLRIVQRSLAHYGDDLITRAGFACTDQLLVNMACLGARITEVPFILRYDRKHGESKLQLGTTIIETFRLLAAGRRRLKAARAGRPMR